DRRVDSKAVTPVRRIPRVGAAVDAQMAKRIGPSAAGQRVDPTLFVNVEPGHFFVETAPARVRVADEERGAELPAASAAEDRGEERILAARHAIGHVHGAED